MRQVAIHARMNSASSGEGGLQGITESSVILPSYRGTGSKAPIGKRPVRGNALIE